MTNFIFKSPRRLVKKLANTPELNILGEIKVIQGQNRFLRQDLVDVKGMLNRLLIDKHLQAQVDDYFEKDPFGSQFRTANQIKEEDEV